MRGFFGIIGSFIDLIIAVVIVAALIVGAVWIKGYLDHVPAGQSFSDSLKGLEQNLTGNSKNLYNDAKKFYDEKNFSASQQKLSELYDSLVKNNQTQQAQQVANLNKSITS
ncbi:Uncharacterised protein [uncultured archaeon]|nr:Uncharacterised protein [uncultured archaeon]